MNIGRPSRPTTIPRAHWMSAAAICRSLTSGKEKNKKKGTRARFGFSAACEAVSGPFPVLSGGTRSLLREKVGLYGQAKGGTGQEGTIQITILNIDQLPDKCQVNL